MNDIKKLLAESGTYYINKDHSGLPFNIPIMRHPYGYRKLISTCKYDKQECISYVALDEHGNEIIPHCLHCGGHPKV